MSEKLTEEAAKEIDEKLESILAARSYLHEEMLSDPLEARSFGITAANVADVLECRLQLVERAVRKIEASTTAGTVNEVPLATLGLGKCDLWKGYIPLALLIHEKMLEKKRSNNSEGAFVLGINAPPGSGKSTLVQVLLFLLSTARSNNIGTTKQNEQLSELRAVSLSSDDLYMGRTAREAVGVSTRLDPRSLDPALFDLVSKLKYATQDDMVELPMFNKGKDDREPNGVRVCGPFDIVFYEGWRVGVQPGELHGSTFDYSALNKPIDFLLYLDADPEDVWTWKLQSSRRDHEREKPEPWTPTHESNLRTMWDRWMLPFLQQHEAALAKLPLEHGGANLVLEKGASHNILKVDLRQKLREYYEDNFPLSPRRSEAAGVLRKAFGRRDSLPLFDKEPTDTSLPDEDIVSIDAFVEVAEQMLQSPGALADVAWHRLVRSSARAATRTQGTFKCATVVIPDGPTGVNDAACRLVSELGNAPSLILIHASTAVGIEAAVKTLAESPCRGAVVHGCTTCLGVISDGSFHEAAAGVLFGIYDPAGCYVSAANSLSQVVEGESSAWKAAASEIAREALESAVARDPQNASTMPLVLLNATPGHEESVLEGIASVLPGAHVFGGSAGDSNFNPSEWRVASGGEVFSAPAVALTLLWPSVQYSLSLNCLHQPSTLANARAVTVTSADTEGRRIFSLDGCPAADVYNKLVDEEANAAPASETAGPDSRTTLNPLARVVVDEAGDTHYFPLHPTPPKDGSLEFLAAPQTGEELVLLRSTRQRLIEEAGSVAGRMRDQMMTTSGQGIAGALVIYCAGCALELERGSQRPGALLNGLGSVLRDALIPAGQSSTHFLGCFTFGEQGPLLSSSTSCHANLMFNVLVFSASGSQE
jgi:pantothenate kinase